MAGEGWSSATKYSPYGLVSPPQAMQPCNLSSHFVVFCFFFWQVCNLVGSSRVVRIFWGPGAYCRCGLFLRPPSPVYRAISWWRATVERVLNYFLVSMVTILQESGAPMGRRALIESVMGVKMEISVDGGEKRNNRTNPRGRR